MLVPARPAEGAGQRAAEYRLPDAQRQMKDLAAESEPLYVRPSFEARPNGAGTSG